MKNEVNRALVAKKKISKTNFSMEKKLNLNSKALRGLFALVLLFSLAVANAWAGGNSSRTYFAVAGAQSTGNGTVYVGNSAATNSSTYAQDKAVCGSGTATWNKYLGKDPGYKTITFYFSAKPTGDKLFLGWKTNPSDVTYTGEAQTFQINYDATGTSDVTNPSFSAANLKRYAYFGDGVITPSTLIYAFDKSGNGTFDVTYISGKTITLTSSNPNFTVSPSSIGAGNSSQAITITYNGSASGIDRTLITIASDGLETQYVDVSAVAGTINSSNANSFTFETGTVNSSTAHPYHPIESLGVSECFAGSTPAFDELYLFGKTLQRTNHSATSVAVGNAVTPCYVYTKSGSSYVFSKVVNMNSDTKGIGVSVTANGQKLYFSGWCPYASAGYKTDDIGVFHITGAANKTVDIYLSNAYISTRTKFNGHATTDYEYTISVSALDILDPNFWVKGGSGGVFVFQTSSTNSSQPFKPSIHVKNSNYLKSNQGNFVRVIVALADYNQPANQCSAPIHMYTTSDSQYETLTIDDVWPTASGSQRTNGALQFAKAVNQSPSIDLGNAHSVVNLNGGRITFANAIPGSTSYTNTFAISCRQFEKSAAGTTAKMYGIGGDRIDGTINFNDGTIDVTPLSDNDYSSYSTLYHDKKSIKVPSTASINGGSHNCAIWKCSSSTEKGSSPTDKSETALCKLTIPETSANANGISSFEIPALFRPGLEEYYTKKGWTYGSSSVSADADGNVHLMLPCDLIDENAIVSVQNIPWVGILPEFVAEASGYSQNMGGDNTAVSDETHVTNRLLYGRIGEFIPSALSLGYTDPLYGASVSLKNTDRNKNVLNEESYLINSSSYVILPIVADQWFAFAAPFDVKKISIIDAYPDALIAEQTNEEALISQAKSNLDLFCYIADAIDNGSQMGIEAMISTWIKCEKEERYPDVDASIQNQFKQRELSPYTSASAASDKNHFWLYENANTWTYNGKNFTGQTLVTGKTDGVLMQKNKVYSLMFSSENVATGDWKYWTGKYIIIEGGENCEIAGKNSQPATNESYTSATTAAIKGNVTLADIPAPANLGAFWGYDYASGTYKHQKSKTNPTQAFLYTVATPNDGTPAELNAIAANGRCYYTISYNSANITVIAAEEAATYSLENNADIKYFYANNGVWKQLTYDNEKALYLGDDAHYYRYDESVQQWELAEYNIIYKDKDNVEFSGTQGSGYPTMHMYGTVTTLVDPSKEGYTFDGWFDNSACTGSALTEIGATAYTADFTLYAKWTANQYTITFDSNGGSAVASITQGYGTSVTAPSDPSKTGYTFKGWNPAVPSTMPLNGRTCVAQWTPNTNTAYTVNHYQQNLDGTYPTTPAETDNLTGTTAVEVTPGVKSYEGFTAPSTQTKAIAADGSMVVDYFYTRNTYTITWKNSNGEILKTDENVPYGTTPSYNGTPVSPSDGLQYTYPFVAWSPVVVSVTGDAEYTATYGEQQLQVYPVKWKNWNGVVVYETTKNYGWPIPEYEGETPVRPKDGNKIYTFAAWSAPVSNVDGCDVTYTALYSLSIDVQESTEPTMITIPTNEQVVTTTVDVKGKLEVDPSAILTTNDLILEGTPTSSGEITGQGSVTATQHAYYDLTKEGGFKAKTWYSVAVPWEVDVPAYDKAKNGVYVKEAGGDFEQQELGRSYDLIYYDGQRRADAGHSDACWKYVEDDDAAKHIMYPGHAYMIYFLKDIETIRFERKEGAALKTTTLAVEAYGVGSTDSKDAGWNGIANPSTFHAFINPNTLSENTYGGVNFGQLYDGDTWTYTPVNLNTSPLVVGQPVYVQVASSNSSIEAFVNHDGAFHAPRSVNKMPVVHCEVGIAASEGKETDRVIVRMLEDKEDAYVIAQDLTKMGVSTTVPQMWVARYDSRLCINTAAPSNNRADYPLGISVPQNGYYVISLDELQDENVTLYLTYNGRAIWNLNYGAYEVELQRGTNTSYGLRAVVYKTPQVTTGVEETTIENGEAIRKVMVDDQVYIIRNGEMYSITGQKAK